VNVLRVAAATPGKGVLITHGRPDYHWQHEVGGALCINLESMWNDFVYSVEKMVEGLRANPGRRNIVVDRWRNRSWTVRPFRVEPVGAVAVASVPAVSAATVMAQPGRGSKSA
jgi:hypothetical protein